MQKKFINTPNTQYFSSYERKHMPPFVVLKHIKLSNLIKHKTTNKEQLTRHAWVIIIDYLYKKTSRLKLNMLGIQLMVDYIQNCYVFSGQCINRNFFNSSDY